jgi:glycerophosphoryl diester phosphodiesterase
MTFFDNFSSRHLIAAHRGFRAHRPENTLSAFKASIGRCHFIELDIQMSRDLVPMVIHDPSLERTSDAVNKRTGLGLKSLKVNNWTLLQLKTLDMGSWFLESDPFGTIYSTAVSPEQIIRELPQTIMTLEEVLNHPALRRMPFNVEIKDHTGKPQDKKVTEVILEVIRRTGSAQRVLISSFNHDYLIIAKTINPHISTAALEHHHHPDNLIEYLHSLGVSAYHPADAITDASLIRELRAAGIGINIYTVNSVIRQRELFTMGATAIFTDYPELHEKAPPTAPPG